MKAIELNNQLGTKIADFYRVTGSDEYCLNEVRKAFRNLNEEEYELTYFDADANFTEIMYNAHAYTFTMAKKVFLIETQKELSDKDKKELLEYVDESDKLAVMVFFDKGNFYSFIDKNCIHIDCSKPTLSELVDQTKDKFTAIGYTFERGAIEQLVNFCSGVPERLDTEITKLKYYKSDEKNIAVKDVEICVSEDIEVKAFDLTNHFTKKDYSAAVATLDNQLRHGVKPAAMLSALASSYRRLFFCALIKDEEKVAELLNTSVSAIKVNKRIITQSGYTQSQLKAILDKLHELEFGFKSGKFSDKSALDLLVSYLITK